MKFGKLSKYINSTEVSQPQALGIEQFDVKFPSTNLNELLPAGAALEAMDPKEILEKIIAFIKKIIGEGIEYYNQVVNRIESKVDETKEKVDRYLNTVGEVSVKALLANAVVEGGEFSFSAYKSTIAKFDAFNNKVINIIKPLSKPRNGVANVLDDLVSATSKLDEIAVEQDEFIETLKEGEEEIVQVLKTTKNEVNRILLSISEVASKNPLNSYNTFSIDANYSKFLDGKDDDIAEVAEYLPKIHEAQKLMINAVNAFNRIRMGFLVGLIAAISLASSTVKGNSNEEFPMDDSQSAHINDDTVPLEVETRPDNALFKQLGTISTESVSIGNFARYFARKAESLNISVREGFKYLTTYSYDPMEQLHPGQMSNYVSTLDFMDHEDVKVPQPNGFKGELLPYTAILIERAQIMNKVLTDVLQPATSRFGHYLSMPMDRAERRDFEYGISIATDRDKLIAEDAKLFGSNRSANASLGELFNSFSDFIDAERNMLTVRSTLGEGSIDSVKKSVTALTITATALIERLGKDTSNKPSNEFVKMISDQLTEVARWVEWYAAQMTRIIETNNAIYAAEKEILKL